ncbi:hypothetical protein [Devosia soli]|uniref:hypothetical protein n=1 Tax=Devosia soli TaxID=361041 RepID=UPI00069A0F35|nr:hypothetical protein [Devosia soli]
MRKLALALLAAGFIATPALAQTALTFADVDSDGDGRLSYEELQVVWPDLTAEEFANADIEGAGSVTPEQLSVLQPAAAPAAPQATPVPAPMDAVPSLPGESAVPPTGDSVPESLVE